MCGYWARMGSATNGTYGTHGADANGVFGRQGEPPNGKLPTANPLTILANSSFRISVDVPVAWNMTPFNREVKIFSGSAHPELAKRIAQSMGAPLGNATVTSFPDGESRVKINENIRGRDVFIVQPTCPP